MRGGELLDEKTPETHTTHPYTMMGIGFCVAATYFLMDQVLYQFFQDSFIVLEISPKTVFWSTNLLLIAIELIAFFKFYRFIKTVNWSEPEKETTLLRNCAILLIITFMILILFQNFWDRLFSDNFFFNLSIYEETLSKSNMYRVLPTVFQFFCIGIFIRSFIKHTSSKPNQVL